MIGDCDNCGHSAMYHLPFVGCTKCSCDEFHAYRARIWCGVRLRGCQ